jgi:hypothetical protein
MSVLSRQMPGVSWSSLAGCALATNVGEPTAPVWLSIAATNVDAPGLRGAETSAQTMNVVLPEVAANDAPPATCCMPKNRSLTRVGSGTMSSSWSRSGSR